MRFSSGRRADIFNLRSNCKLGAIPQIERAPKLRTYLLMTKIMRFGTSRNQIAPLDIHAARLMGHTLFFFCAGNKIAGYTENA
jgi:hypothetical protein